MSILNGQSLLSSGVAAQRSASQYAGPRGTS